MRWLITLLVLPVVPIVSGWACFAQGLDDASMAKLKEQIKEEVLNEIRKVVILLREAGSKENGVLLKKIYKVTDKELRRMWVRKIYKGEITSPPRLAFSPSSMIRTVMKEEGGIGVVKAEDVTDDVKVLKIDGKLPLEPGYPLEE